MPKNTLGNNSPNTGNNVPYKELIINPTNTRLKGLLYGVSLFIKSKNPIFLSDFS